MIWLPGFLSQGGKKFTWERYKVAYSTVQGSGSSSTFTESESPVELSSTYSINQNNGLFFIGYDGMTEYTIGDLALKVSFGALTVYDDNTSGGSVAGYFNTIYKRVITAVNSATRKITQTTYPLSVSKSKGDYVDIVSDVSPDAYPSNGIQGGYWYVKIS